MPPGQGWLITRSQPVRPTTAATAEMIQVRQQFIVADRHPALAPPKTSASGRDVPMPKLLQDAIARHVGEPSLANSDVLCRIPRRTLLRRNYYNRETWKPALAPNTASAGTSHTLASTALAEGVPISEVSRWLGHKSITTTVDLSVTPGSRGQRPGP